MKKLFTLFIAFIAFTAWSVSAQTLCFTYNGETVAVNDTIHYEYTDDDIDAGMVTNPKLGMINQSSSELTVQLGLTDLNIAPNHSLAFCVNENCYATDVTPTMTFQANETIEANDARSFHFNFEPASTGETTVRIYARNVADETDEATFYVHYYYNDGTGVDERTTSTALKAYPNPASNQVTIEYGTEQVTGTQLVIKNIAGAVVYREEASPSGKMIISVTEFKAGLYFYGLADQYGKMICAKKLLVK